LDNKIIGMNNYFVIVIVIFCFGLSFGYETITSSSGVIRCNPNNGTNAREWLLVPNNVGSNYFMLKGDGVSYCQLSVSRYQNNDRWYFNTNFIQYWQVFPGLALFISSLNQNCQPFSFSFKASE